MEQTESNDFMEIDPGNVVMLRSGDGYLRLPPPEVSPEEATRKPSIWKRLLHTLY